MLLVFSLLAFCDAFETLRNYTESDCATECESSASLIPISLIHEDKTLPLLFNELIPFNIV